MQAVSVVFLRKDSREPADVTEPGCTDMLPSVSRLCYLKVPQQHSFRSQRHLLAGELET